jgi:hypothetical protein
LPCKVCEVRGFRCGQDEKIWGPQRQLETTSTVATSAQQVARRKVEILPSLPTPLDEAITNLDRKYLQGILDRLQLSKDLSSDLSSMLQMRGITGHVFGDPISLTMAIPWPTFPLSSKPFRYAALTFSSSQSEAQQGNSNTDTLVYLAKFYKYTQEAITASSFAEVAVGCYTILLYSYMAHESFETSLIHFDGLSGGYASLRQGESASSTNQLAWIDVLWRGGLQVMVRKFWSRNHMKHLPPGEATLLADLSNILRRSSCLLLPDSGLQSSEWINSSYTRLETLGCYLSIYWDHYLALQSLPPQTGDVSQLPTVTKSIHEVLQQIIDVVPQLPNPRLLLQQATEDVNTWKSDSATLTVNYLPDSNLSFPHVFTFEDERATLLYAYARLIADFLMSPTAPKIQLVPSALLLCRLCAPALRGYLPRRSPFGLQMTRYWFWLGLVLTQSMHPAGNLLISFMLTYSTRFSSHCLGPMSQCANREPTQ